MDKSPKREGPAFEALLASVVAEPGVLSECYRAFHGYSIGNQIAAWSQCVAREKPIGPLATFQGWKERGRYVQKGERALVLCMPVTMKRTDKNAETGEDQTHTFNRFVWRANWFTVHQTEGGAFEPAPASPAWDKATALAALEVTETRFEMADGNCQGYATGRCVAVSPVAVLPHKTLFHELAHVVLGHTAEVRMSDTDGTPKDIREVEAEATAFILTATLGLPGLAESRGYVQHWLKGQAIPERSAQRIFSAANTILKAGAAS